MRNLLQDFLHACKRERGLALSTLASYDEAGRLFLAWAESDLDRTPTLLDWTRPNAQAFAAHERQRGIRQTTLRNRVAALRAWGIWLIEHEHCTANPWLAVKTPVNEALRQPCPSQDTVTALLHACDSVPNRRRGAMIKAAIALAALAGLRTCELVALRVEDIHLAVAEPYVHIVAGKGGNSGNVPLGRVACGILAAWLVLRAPVGVPNLLYLRGGKLGDRPYSKDAFIAALRMLKSMALLDAEDIPPHSLRRFGGTMIAQQAGASVADAQAFLRHSEPATTLRYLKRTRDLRGFVDAMLQDDSKPAPAPASPVRRGIVRHRRG